MGCVFSIPFAPTAPEPPPKEAAILVSALATPRFKKLTEDPRVILVVIGYGGRIALDESPENGSLHRAESIVRDLREKCELGNAMYAFGLGKTASLTGATSRTENYVEVWAILPPP